jgi:hypothetical protein
MEEGGGVRDTGEWAVEYHTVCVRMIGLQH